MGHRQHDKRNKARKSKKGTKNRNVYGKGKDSGTDQGANVA